MYCFGVGRLKRFFRPNRGSIKIQEKGFDDGPQEVVNVGSILVKNVATVWNCSERGRSDLDRSPKKGPSPFETTDLVLFRPHHEARTVSVQIGGCRKDVVRGWGLFAFLVLCSIDHVSPMVGNELVLECFEVAVRSVSERQSIDYFVGNFWEGVLLDAIALLFAFRGAVVVAMDGFSSFGICPENIPKEMLDVLPALKVQKSMVPLDKTTQKGLAEKARKGRCDQDCLAYGFGSFCSQKVQERPSKRCSQCVAVGSNPYHVQEFGGGIEEQVCVGLLKGVDPLGLYALEIFAVANQFGHQDPDVLGYVLLSEKGAEFLAVGTDSVKEQNRRWVVALALCLGGKHRLSLVIVHGQTRVWKIDFLGADQFGMLEFQFAEHVRQRDAQERFDSSQDRPGSLLACFAFDWCHYFVFV